MGYVPSRLQPIPTAILDQALLTGRMPRHFVTGEEMSLNGLEAVRPRHPYAPQLDTSTKDPLVEWPVEWSEKPQRPTEPPLVWEHDPRVPLRRRPWFVAWCWRMEARARRLDEWIERMGVTPPAGKNRAEHHSNLRTIL